MRINTGEALRRGWEQGNLPCKHPEVVDEQDETDKDTGKRLCTTCGEYMAMGLGMRYVDVTPALRQAATDGRIVYFPDDTHWTEEGHRVAAQVVHENLRNAAETKKQHSLNDTRTHP